MAGKETTNQNVVLQTLLERGIQVTPQAASVSSKVPINPVTTEVSTSQAIACSSQPTLPITTAKRPACTQQINSCLPNTSKRQKLGNPPVLDAVFEGEKSSDPQSFGYVVEMLADVKRCMIGAIEACEKRTNEKIEALDRKCDIILKKYR